MLTLDPRTCFQKNAFITYLVGKLELLKSPLLLDNAAIQRLVYVLQEIFAVPLAYDFSLYNYGPYSADLTGDIEYTEYLGGIKTYDYEDASATGSTVLKTGEKSAHFSKEALDFLRQNRVDNLDETLAKIKDFTSQELDVLSTLHMIYDGLDEKEITKEFLVSRLREVKPKLNEPIMEKMLKFLVDCEKVSIKD